MEKIAIIGLGCRFPAADNPEAFWQLLRNGVDAVSEIPPERWNVDELYHLEPGTPGKMCSRWGAFLPQVEQFDPVFFDISPREAERIDPQQRLFLEVAWEALENAGLNPHQLAGSQTGVFLGMVSVSYDQFLFKNVPDLTQISAYDGLGTTMSIAANRLSYLLDLKGPSLAVETACSSSLVAFHLACQSLRAGETNLCVVGGVQLILTPEENIILSQAQMLSPDGRSKTFDASANGYVRGEGCGAVILKRLSDALRDGDRILAIVRGSAINQDGRSNGLTAPNGPSQQSVIRQALANAGVEPAQISYVETHGTGTPLGDPIEVKSLKAVLMEGRQPEQACWLGSVKTNIGHLEAAAGIAGLIKTVLCLQHREIPPHLHLKQLNPYIRLKNTPLSIATELQEWSVSQGNRLAGVSSFGFGGTNAHAILEEAPHPVKKEGLSERPLHLLTLSAKSEPALLQLAQKYQEFLASHPTASLPDICFTANTGRAHFNHRLAVAAESTEQLSQQLKALESGTETTGSVLGQLTSKEPPKIAFLFTGQGSQYLGMGRQLYETQPIFKSALDRCAKILDSYLDQPLLKILYLDPSSPSLLDQTVYTQPALFAIEYALVQLWQSWGIQPDAVMGHSVGEYVAACTAGVFSLEDGLKLIAHRGRLMQNLAPNGKMVSVLADETTIRAAIDACQKKVAVAAFNGCQSTVISGQQDAIESVTALLEGEGIKTKSLVVSHAFHSPLMEPMLEEFEQIAQTVTYSSPQIPLVSNVTGELAGDDIANAEYWCRHILQPVRFAQSLEKLNEQEYEVFLEIGPKPVLLGMARLILDETPKAEPYLLLPSLRQGVEDWQQMLDSLGQLYVRGISIDGAGFDRDYPRHKVELPTYPFQRQRYWIETSEKRQQKTGSVALETEKTQIIDLLHQGNTHLLAQQLQKAGNLSPSEVELLPKLLEVLIQQNQQQLAAATIQDWFYQVEWKLLPANRQEPNFQPSHWLIFADFTGVGKAIASQLQQQGHQCTLVYRGDTYQNPQTGIYEINPSQPQEFAELYQQVVDINQLPPQRVIHLWSLDAPAPADLTVAALEKAQIWGCGSVLHLLKAILKNPNSNSLPQLWLATRGAQPVRSQVGELAVAQAPLWGFARAISLEHPQLWGGLVDLDPQAPEDEVKILLQQIANSEPEDHLALRVGRTHVARLVKKHLTPTQPVSLRPDGTYLIAGGLGALGLHVTEWMVEKGARHLVLLSRRPPSPDAQRAISRLQQQGVEVIVAQADVSSQEEMARVLEELENSLPPLKGVVHGAGVGEFRPLAEMELEQLEVMLRPKVTGGWILHQLTKTRELDFFVGFSSIAAVWGSFGQAHYGAANHFLDGLAHYRQTQGLPSFSINWGPWSGEGMADGERRQKLSKRGMESLLPQQGIAALEQVLPGGSVQTTVANVNWSIFKKLYEMGRQRLLLEEIEAESLATPPITSKEAANFLQQIESLPESERLSQLSAYLQREVAQVLRLEAGQIPPIEQGFFEIGMDSLMVLELKQRLENSFNCSFPSTLAFEFPNISTMSQYIAQQILNWEISEQHQLNQDLTTVEAASNQASILAKIQQLSEQGLEDLINREFAELTGGK